MEISSFEYSFLDWDTEYFDVTTGRIVLHEEASSTDKEQIKEKLLSNKLTVIYNENNNPLNNIWLGEETSSRLIDVNIQFMKLAKSFSSEKHDNVFISQQLPKSEEILEIASQSFRYSRFFNELNFDKTKAKLIYWNWVYNSFEKEGKFFAQYIIDSVCQGFILFSIKDSCLIIELIAVKKYILHKGIGTKLIKTLESYAKELNVEQIRVGTQLNNVDAVRFYLKNGYLYNTATSIYHHWLNEELE